MVDPRPNNTDQLPADVDGFRVGTLIVLTIPLLHAAFHLCCIVGHQGKMLEVVASGDGASKDKVIKG